MSYIALANITLTSTDSDITFSNIPTSVNGVALRDLVLTFVGSNSQADMRFRLNNDSGANYTWVYAEGNGSSTGSGGETSPKTYASWSYAPSNYREFTVLQIMDYSATDKHKTILTRGNQPQRVAVMSALRWASTSAVNSISLFESVGGVFAAGSTFTLYGVAG
jgi:hypothetical protein